MRVNWLAIAILRMRAQKARNFLWYSNTQVRSEEA